MSVKIENMEVVIDNSVIKGGFIKEEIFKEGIEQALAGIGMVIVYDGRFETKFQINTDNFGEVELTAVFDVEDDRMTLIEVINE